MAVTPGSQASVQLRVRNTGSVVDQFTFQVLGDAQPWSTVVPPSLSLFPGAEEAVAITFAPPRSAQAPAGQLPFGVRIVSKEDPQGSVVEEGVLEIAPFSDIFAELAPRTSRGSRGATHDLAIDNRGNAAINANLTAVDPDRLLNFDSAHPASLLRPVRHLLQRLASARASASGVGRHRRDHSRSSSRAPGRPRSLSRARWSRRPSFRPGRCARCCYCSA